MHEMGTSSPSNPKTYDVKGIPLIDVHQVEVMFPPAICIAGFSWVFLVLLIYSLVPPEDYVYLDGPERDSAEAACYVFMASTMLSIVAMGSQKTRGWVLNVALSVQCISMCTNAMLAWFPTVVLVDPVTNGRVHVIRYVECIPLVGLLSFFAEAVDSRQGLYGVLMPLLTSLGQSLSCLLAIILPFCPSSRAWLLAMLLSVALFLTKLPRLLHKYRDYQNSNPGHTVEEMERHYRIRFGFSLLLACSLVRTTLVAFYFYTFLSIRYFPDSCLLQNESFFTVLGTLFDVFSKALYMYIIVSVHETVFDSKGRAQRQISDLKRIAEVAWENSPDVIVVSVRKGSSITTTISPHFPSMIGASVPSDSAGKALVVKSGAFPSPSVRETTRLRSTTYLVDSSADRLEGTIARDDPSLHLPNVQMDNFLNDQADKLVKAAWACASSLPSCTGKTCGDTDDADKTGRGESLQIVELLKMDKSTLEAEMKVSRHPENPNDTVVAVVRHVTRSMRDAGRQETLEDDQAANRFLRHEIKNGLLASIELCHEVAKRVDLLKSYVSIPIERLEEIDAGKCMAELDSTLYEVLETLLAETMAKEVVQETYSPKLERVDVYETLASETGDLHLCPNDMPCLSMDPQLLRYIHRNAVSNACKYGAEGAKVSTEVHYFEKKGEFEMDVINEPGPFNQDLMLMGEQASENVFSRGTRLNVHSYDDNRISAGDGAWIMQKCAKTMGGQCSIRFESHQTVFTFRCKVKPYQLPWKDNVEFQVPPNTWGVGFDDSPIQRKLLTRLLKYAGVDESRIVVKGESASDVEGLGKVMQHCLSKDPTSKVLVLMDENLDYDCNGVVKRFSGSKCCKEALLKLSPAQQARALVLLRSANDSDSEVQMYRSRAHGSFPKAYMRKQKVREILEREWRKRFRCSPDFSVPDIISTDDDTQTLNTSSSLGLIELTNTDTRRQIMHQSMSSLSGLTISDNELLGESAERISRQRHSHSSSNSSLCITDDELRECLDNHVGRILASRESETKGRDWGATLGALHALKGDLMVMEGKKRLHSCVDIISSMQSDSEPADFAEKWGEIHNLLLQENS